MKSHLLQGDLPRRAFSLVEVVVALGVVAFAVIAILGMLPVALSSDRAAQDNTRAPQIAQSIFAMLAAQAIQLDSKTGLPFTDGSGNAQLNNSIKLPQVTSSIDLTQASSSAYQFYADTDGLVTDSQTGAVYSIMLNVDTVPAGFDTGSAAQVTVSVAWPINAAAGNQVKRDFVRVISRY